jgi:predicted metal-dependent hydrolase
MTFRRPNGMEMNVAGAERPVYIEYKRNRNMYLRVNEDGSLSCDLSALGSPAGNSYLLLRRKRKWIAKNESEMSHQKSTLKTGLDGKTASWLGRHLSH